MTKREKESDVIAKLQAELKDAESKISWLEKNREQLQNRILKIEERYSKQVASFKWSVRYRTGDALIDALLSPKQLLRLPIRMWRIFDDYRKKRVHPPPTMYQRADASQEPKQPLPKGKRGKAQEARLLFMPTNGAGLGHVTRLLAIARRMKNYPGIAEIVFVTTSESLHLFRAEGFTAYYFPPAQQLNQDLTAGEWQSSLFKLLEMVIANHKINALVFDGVSPYSGVIKAIKKTKNMYAVWVRRGLLKSHLKDKLSDAERYFNLQIIPGELGQTEVVKDSPGKVTVPPIVYLDRHELLSRDEVMNSLRLNPAKKTVLVQLGAGNINEIVTQIEVIADVASRFDNVQTMVAESIIATTELQGLKGITLIRDYPLSRYYLGVDVAISAAGYNTMAELMYFGIPSLFIPNLETASDDQLARAKISEEAGTGMVLSPLYASGLKECLTTLLDDDKNAEFRQRCLARFSVNGSDTAAQLLAEFLQVTNEDKE